MILCMAARGLSLNLGDRPYDVARIPQALRIGSQAVVRINHGRFEVRNSEHAHYIVKRAVTVFSKEKRDWGKLVLGYDRFSSIEDIEGALYDASGERIRTLASEDIKDVSAISSMSIYDDHRIRTAELYNDSYPYTVEFEYEISYSGSLNWPKWYAQSTIDAVEQSSFEVVASVDAGVRYWCNRLGVQPQLTRDGGDITYRWQAAGLPSIPKDAVGYLEDATTIVRIAPTSFVLEGFEGTMESWLSLGKWFQQLYVGADELPQQAVQDIQALVKPNDTPRDKTRKTYRYLQSRIRYVSIQLGIGGWKPFNAAFVHEHGYGDCKALSNYATALLRAAGIAAYPVSIYSGYTPQPMVTEFPSNQFNHQIVCVPLPGDTVWLECTSRSAPFGHLGDDIENRPALMLTPTGGIVVHTPSSTAAQNLQRRTGTITLIWTGGAEARVTTSVFGNEQDEVRHEIAESPAEQRRKWALRTIPVTNPSLTQLDISGADVPSDSIAVTIGFSTPRLASSSGNRMFFVPNLMERNITAPSPYVVRVSPVRLRYPLRRVDSLVYRLPVGYKVEALPTPVKLVPSFGNFSCSTIARGDTSVVYTRFFECRETVIPLEKYDEYRTFLTEVVKADRAQAVLVKK